MSARRGFTLLEVVVVVAILSILAGAAVPAVARIANRAARTSTRAELASIAEAATELFRDTGAPPAAILDLEERPDGAQGWTGPYLAASTYDAAGVSGWELDGWSRPYRLEAEDQAITIASAGEDGRFASADDEVVRVDFTPILRERTLETVAIANRAIASWYALRPGEPLPLDVHAALERLVEAELLPDAERFARDAWGRPLVADPLDRGPLVRVRAASADPAARRTPGTADAGRLWRRLSDEALRPR